MLPASPTTDLSLSQNVVNVLALPEGARFEDIDWGAFFQDTFNYSYHNKFDFSPYRSGNRLDVERLHAEKGWNLAHLMRYMNPDQSPNLPLIFQALDSRFMTSGEMESLTLAIPDLSQLTPEDQARLQKGLFRQISLSLHQFSDLIAKLELLYPAYIQSFRLIENLFPKVLQRPHIFNTPACISGTVDKNFQHFKSVGYGEEEAHELAQQMSEYQTTVMMLRKIHHDPHFPLKQTAKLRIDAERRVIRNELIK